MTGGLKGSQILQIATEIRDLRSRGETVCDLTVGDFSPQHFPIPEKLRDGIASAIMRGETNYPPAAGILELRQAVRRFYLRDLGLDYPVESIMITCGARPVIYGTYRAVCDPKDRVLYPVPSWNNHYYVHMVEATGVPIPTSAASRFLPTPEQIIEHLAGARLISLNSPLNPTGTAIEPEALRGICEAVLNENRRRETRGERPVYLLYDHIYWMLSVGETPHVTPSELFEEMARYTIYVDGISKGFAATGVRVGWAVGPVDIVARMRAVLSHAGAWAPRAEQCATTEWLDDVEGIAAYQSEFKKAISARLNKVYEGLMAMKGRGCPVDAIPPMGAIYLTVRIAPFGRRTEGGAVLDDSEAVRSYLLEEARIGIVPFAAFGVSGDDGWFRFSVGATSLEEIEDALPRLEKALLALS